MAEYYIHLKETDTAILFPMAVDTVPVILQKRNYVDAWLYNRWYSMILNIQQYVIDHRSTIEVE